MSFYKDKPYNRRQDNNSGRKNYRARNDFTRPPRYFHWESTKDGNDRSKPPEYTVPESSMNVPVHHRNIIEDNVPNLPPNVFPNFSRDEGSNASSSTVPPITNVVAQVHKNIKPRKKKDVVKLNELSLSKLTSQEGVEFLQKLSDKTKVKFKVIPQGRTKKYKYACVVEGAKKKKEEAVREIRTFCQDLLKDAKLSEAEPFDLMQVFQGLEFNMQVLEESLCKLENPNVNWVKLTVNLHKKVRAAWGCYHAIRDKGDLIKTKESLNLLQRQYIAMHAVLLGKLDIKDSLYHLEILKRALKNGITEECNEEMVRNSYKYIFQSPERLDINYASETEKLPPHLCLKTEIDGLLESATSICNKKGMQGELAKLKSMYGNLIHCHYSERKLFQFREHYETIKKKDDK